MTRSSSATASLGFIERLWLVARLAWRELRSGLSGFGILVACIALGVTVITGVSALSEALLDGFSTKGRMLLGGDVSLTRVHQQASAEERRQMEALGAVSEVAVMRSMARVERAGAVPQQTLVEITGVDDAYPLVGVVELDGDRDLKAVLRDGAAVPKSLLDRLDIAVGDTIRLGGKTITIASELVRAPDQVGGRLPFGPRVLLSLQTMRETGLVQPGALISWRYSIAMPAGATNAGDLESRARAVRPFTQAGFMVTDRANPSPRVTTLLGRLRDFLILLGLTALLVGGVGVSNAVSTFVDRQRRIIATYKSVGASHGLVFAVLMAQILAISGVGIAIGLAAGAAIPFGAAVIYGDVLPIEINPGLGWRTLIVGTVYGLLVAVLFTAWPVGQAGRIRPAALFRDDVAAHHGWPGRAAFIIATAAALGLIGFAVLMSGKPTIAAGFIAGVSVVLALFFLLGFGVVAMARRLPRPSRPELALAMTGLAAPGGLTRSVIVSLGAGLSLLVAVALVDRSLVAELEGSLPADSPNFFAIDITKRDLVTFRDQVHAGAANAQVRTAPMLRGRIVKLKGISAEDYKTGEGAWALRGDRGLSFSQEIPEASKLIAGKWWPNDYAGAPLVSFAAGPAKDLGLQVGDTVTVNVLGRNVTARIASLREVNWQSLAINFVMVFSPNTLEAAPYNLLATVQLVGDDDAVIERQEAAIGRAVAQVLPGVTLIRVREAIAAFAELFANVMAAVRAAGAITLLAGALVLAGALATAQRKRIGQAVILKCVGATRRRLLFAHVAEYGLLALIAAVLAIIVGAIAAWIITVFVLEVGFVLSWTALATAVLVSIGLVLGLGAIGTIRVLQARPVPYLRNL